MGRLENKVAMVTGGASGIGRATAQLLARQGATVVLTDIDIQEGKFVVEGIKAEGGSAIRLVTRRGGADLDQPEFEIVRGPDIERRIADSARAMEPQKKTMRSMTKRYVSSPNPVRPRYRQYKEDFGSVITGPRE